MADQKRNDQNNQKPNTRDNSGSNKAQQNGQSPNRNASSSNIKTDKSQMKDDE